MHRSPAKEAQVPTDPPALCGVQAAAGSGGVILEPWAWLGAYVLFPGKSLSFSRYEHTQSSVSSDEHVPWHHPSPQSDNAALQCSTPDTFLVPLIVAPHPGITTLLISVSGE